MTPNQQMYSLISSFPQQVGEALLLMKKIDIGPALKEIDHVVICGMGGSGIGGTIVSEVVKQEARFPITICKSYSIPESVNNRSLVIACSYSGNTEETIAAFHSAKGKGANIVCISSGGKLKGLAKKYHAGHIALPAGFPPRAAMAYSLVMLFYVLHHYNITPAGFTKQFHSAVKLLNEEQPSIIKESRAISKKILNKIPVTYIDSEYEGVAIRFRQQLAENAKILSWHHVIPEMNHNELVGWAEKRDDIAVIFFRTGDGNDRVKKRFDFCADIFRRFSSTVIEISAKGNNDLQRALYLIHFGDWISWSLAELRGVDAMEVKVIERLKEELGK